VRQLLEVVGINVGLQNDGKDSMPLLLTAQHGHANYWKWRISMSNSETLVDDRCQKRVNFLLFVSPSERRQVMVKAFTKLYLHSVDSKNMLRWKRFATIQIPH
jgi:hypothetical protein